MLGSIIVKRFGLYTYRCTCNARGHIQNIKYAQSRDCFILQDVSVERAQCMRWSFVQHARNTCCIRREVYYMRSVYGMPALCMRQVYAQRVGNTLCIRCKLAEASPKFWQELDARRRTDQFSVFWLNFQRAGHASAMCDHRLTNSFHYICQRLIIIKVLIYMYVTSVQSWAVVQKWCLINR